MIRVLVVDDHHLFREGLVNLLLAEGGVEVVGEAAGGREAIDLAQQLQPDVVLLDLRMPDLSGLEVIKVLKESLPTARVVVLTAHHEEEEVVEALANGADGYLLKNLRSKELISMLHLVHRGEAAITPSIAVKMFRDLARRSPHQASEAGGLQALTEREIDVVQHVARGLTNAEIATTLFVSESTVKYHLSNILHKLQMQNRSQLATYAVQQGLLK